MAGREAVQIDLTLNELDAKRGLQNVEKQSKKTFRSFEQDTKRGVRAGGRFSTMLGGMTSRLVAMGAAYLSVATAKKAVAAFIEQEKAVGRLNAALKVQGTVSKAISKDMQDYASWLQSVTTFGDEATLAQMALAVSMGATSEQAKQLATAAADMSVALDMSYSEATMQLSRTLSGEIGRLGMIIPELKKMSIADRMAGGAIGVAQKKFGGMAQDLANTKGGKLQQALNTFGDQMETLGEKIFPPILAGFAGLIRLLNGGGGSEEDALRRARQNRSFHFGLNMAHPELQDRQWKRDTAEINKILEGMRGAKADLKEDQETERAKILLKKQAAALDAVNEKIGAAGFKGLHEFTGPDVVAKFEKMFADASPKSIAGLVESLKSPEDIHRERMDAIEKQFDAYYALKNIEGGIPNFSAVNSGRAEKDALNAERLGFFRDKHSNIHQFSQDLGGGIKQSVGDAIHEGLNGGNAIEAFSQSLAESATTALTAALTEALIGDALQDLLDGIGMAAAGVK